MRIARLVAIPVSIATLCVAFVPSLLAQTGKNQQAAEHVGSAWIVATAGPKLTFDFKGNSGSTLDYDWVMVIDSSLGLVFDGPAGARAAGSPAEPAIKLDADVRALVPISAYEIRVLTFDVWRNHTSTLYYSRLQDIKAGDKKRVDRKWYGFSPSEARLQLTSLAFVAKVRYEDGRAVIADLAPVLRAAQVISKSITAQDLLPTAKATEDTLSTEL